MVHDVIKQRIIPRIERDGISKLILPEQITSADCGKTVERKRLPLKRKREDELAIGLTGKVSYCIDNKKFIFAPGKIALIPAGFPHAPIQTIQRHVRELDVDQAPSLLWLAGFTFGVIMQVSQVIDDMYWATTPPYMFLGRDFDRLISRLVEEARSRPIYFKRLGRHIFLELMLRCLRATTDADVVAVPKPAKVGTKHLSDRVQAALEFIYSNYHSPIVLDDIAAATDTSATHLIKQFRTALGRTPVAYLLKVRMAAARELLQTHTDMRIAEVASVVGIKDANYFSRIFQRENGISALAYRSKMTKKAAPTPAAKAKSRKPHKSRK